MPGNQWNHAILPKYTSGGPRTARNSRSSLGMCKYESSSHLPMNCADGKARGAYASQAASIRTGPRTRVSLCCTAKHATSAYRLVSAWRTCSSQTGAPRHRTANRAATCPSVTSGQRNQEARTAIRLCTNSGADRMPIASRGDGRARVRAARSVISL